MSETLRMMMSVYLAGLQTATSGLEPAQICHEQL
jgi:hypothetical protein